MMAARRNRQHTAGLTLIELIVVVTLVAVLTGGVVMGMGATTNARIRSAATLVASGVRVAFTRAASTSKSMRLVFDLDKNLLILEESSMPMLIRRNDETGTDGSSASNPIEKAALAEAERVVKGPTAPRPMFKPAQAFGFDAQDPSKGRELGAGVAFRRVEIAHNEEPYLSGRAYLYFWPGGQTERASIQIGRKSGSSDASVVSVLVSPLTGRVRIVGGAKPMERTREDSEREDTGF